MTGGATEEYLLEVYTRDHRIFLARLDSLAYLLERIDCREWSAGERLMCLVLRAVMHEIGEATCRFVRAYEALDLEARLGPALGLGPDPLAAERAYFGSPEEATQKLFVWPFMSIFFSESYSDLVTREWRAALDADSDDAAWCEDEIRALARRHLDEDDAACLDSLDLRETFSSFVEKMLPRLRAAAEEHKEPLRFVTRRYNIGDGVPFRDDYCLAGFDFSTLDLEDEDRF